VFCCPRFPGTQQPRTRTIHLFARSCPCISRYDSITSHSRTLEALHTHTCLSQTLEASGDSEPTPLEVWQNQRPIISVRKADRAHRTEMAKVLFVPGYPRIHFLIQAASLKKSGSARGDSALPVTLSLQNCSSHGPPARVRPGVRRRSTASSSDRRKLGPRDLRKDESRLLYNDVQNPFSRQGRVSASTIDRHVRLAAVGRCLSQLSRRIKRIC
jgi:hypothetical protein